MPPISRNCRRRQQGITRRELVIIIAIVVVIALVLGEHISRRASTARQAQLSSDLERIAAGLHQYKLDNLRYPTAEQGLEALLAAPQKEPLAPRWKGPYINRATLLIDPWGVPYRYHSEDAPPGFTLASYGADGQEEGEGANADILLKYQSAGG